MTDSDISTLLRKADELKALFILGQRVIPFLEEIFIFVNEIKPLLNEINVSIQENLKKMPGASKQLSKVTEATEMATTEIMDTLDGLVNKADHIGQNFKDMARINFEDKHAQLRAIAMIQSSYQKGSDIDNALHQAASAIEKSNNISSDKINEINTSTENLLNSLKEDSSSIMMSLQVQDITSQQIAAVNHLLETVQQKLENIMVRFQSSDLGEMLRDEDNHDSKKINISTLHRQIAFDPTAVDSIEMQETRQNDVDAIFRANDEGTLDSIDMTEHRREEISPAASTQSARTVAAAPVATMDDEAFSQDDIDALFGN